MKKSSIKKLLRVSIRLSVLSGVVDSIRQAEERRRDLFPAELRNAESFERLRFTCDVLEEAESNIDEARDNISSVLK